MANELTLSGSLVYNDSDSDELPLQVREFIASVAAKIVSRNIISVPTSEVSIPLAQVAAPGWSIFINRGGTDDTDYISLRVASAGARFAKLLPGEFAILRLGADAQVPYAISTGAACKLDYLIVDT